LSKLFPIASSAKSEAFLYTGEDALVPVRNVSNVCQIFGRTIINPGSVELLPARLARTLSGRKEFEIQWGLDEYEDGKTLQVIRHPGLGDAVFACAAIWAHKKEFPFSKIYFQTFDYNKTWLDWVPFLKFGLAESPDKVVNFDNMELSCGDRTEMMGRMLGVSADSISFPINIPEKDFNLPKNYIAFSPFNQSRSIRSLPTKTIRHILDTTDLPLVFLDSKPLGFPTKHIDLGGKLKVEELWQVINGAKAVISVDTGPAWIGASLKRPTLICFSCVPPQDRLMTTETVWAMEPNVSCYPCRDVSYPPKCSKDKTKPLLCMEYYEPKLLEYKIREFLGNI
jgi:Glycosyltransferase family 9 (heptosyltransferase)